jgi:hypothetical protein
MPNFNGTALAPAPFVAGTVQSVVGSVTWGSTLASADTFTFTNLLPANPVEPIAVSIWGSEPDTNASPTATLVFGNSDSANGYLTSKTAGGAVQQYRVDGDGALLGTLVSNRTLIGLLGGTMGTGSAAGTLYVKVDYVCQNHQ